MKIGLIGLGKMGSRMASKLLKDGFEIHVWNRSEDVLEEFKSQNSKGKSEAQNLKVARSIEELINNLGQPKIIWIMVSHGAVEEVLSEVKKFVKPGDVIIDGGNSYYKDTDKRYEEFKKSGIHFLGIGTSGGILASENGYPFMVGGSREGYEMILPILNSLTKPNGGHEYFGEGGAGHFVKMVHNGIEYGFMQSLGEGFDVLKNSKYKFDLLKIAGLYQKGTLVSGFMIDRLKDALVEGDVDECVGIIQASGEAAWTVEAAKEEGVETEIIEKSLEYRNHSKTDPKIQNSYTAKMVAALRREFGGHEVKKK